MDSDLKRYQVIVSDEATQMLLTHVRYLARVSEAAANDLIAEFSQKAKSLESLPERNSWLSDLFIPKEKYRKIQLLKWYLILYQVKGNNVFVDAVVDCRQDYSWLLI